LGWRCDFPALRCLGIGDNVLPAPQLKPSSRQSASRPPPHDDEVIERHTLSPSATRHASLGGDSSAHSLRPTRLDPTFRRLLPCFIRSGAQSGRDPSVAPGRLRQDNQLGIGELRHFHLLRLRAASASPARPRDGAWACGVGRRGPRSGAPCLTVGIALGGGRSPPEQ